MGNVLDFSAIQKKYLTVKLADEKKTTIMIGTPDKKTMEEFLAIQSSLTSSEIESNDEKMDCLYSICARLMSRNKAGIKIAKKTIEDTFDFEDIMIFFSAYMNFISEVMKTKK